MDFGKKQIRGYIIGGLLVWVVIPMIIYFCGTILAKLMNDFEVVSGYIRAIFIGALLIMGLSFGIWSVYLQNKLGNGGPVQIGNLDISPRTQKLLVSGPYKYTRNPMLFGACMIYCGYALYLNSFAALLIVALFSISMMVFVKISEEKRLLRDFGKEYEEYRRDVSFFIPWVHKRRKK